MAESNVDPLEFKSWEEAFDYPLPVVRQFEKRLRNHAEDGQQKLRGMVGASYRKLLETADEIILMQETSQRTETLLGDCAHLCSSRTIERIQEKRYKHRSGLDVKAKLANGEAAEVSLLQHCASVLTTLSKHPDSLLVAAKVLVLARLVLTTISRRPQPLAYVDTLRSKLAKVRQLILRRLEKRIASSKAPPQTLTDNLCAYALATSATPKDVLRHVLSTRRDTIRRHLQKSSSPAKYIVQALTLLIRTTQEVPSLFAKTLPQGLTKLRSKPLLQHKDMRAIEELRLSTVEGWLPEELHNYKPWMRQDDLRPDEITAQLKTWASETFAIIAAELPETLTHINSVDEVITTRKSTLEIWRSLSRRSSYFKATNSSGDLRNCFQRRIVHSIQIKADSLSEVAATLEMLYKQSGPQVESLPTTIWSPRPTSKDLNLKSTVTARLTGLSEQDAQILKDVEDWQTSVLQIGTALIRVKAERWDDDVSDDSDDDDTSYTSGSKSNVEDADELRQLLQKAVSRASADFRSRIASLVRNSFQDNDQPISKVVSLTRILGRLAMQPRFSSDRNLELDAPLKDIGVVEPLWNIIGDHVLSQTQLVAGTDVVKRGLGRAQYATILWEGTPPLPMQPSPYIVRFLKDLTTSMSTCGLAVCGPGLVAAVKTKAVEAINNVVRKDLLNALCGNTIDHAVNGMSSEHQDQSRGQEEDAERPDTASLEQVARPDSHANRPNLAGYAQLLYDLLYLRQALALKHHAQESAQAFEEQVTALEAHESLSAASSLKMERSARDYWRRTYLLFALLH